MSVPSAILSGPPREAPRKDPSLMCAHAAMASMLQQGLAPTPANYLIWYSFHGRLEPGLCHLMENLLQQGGKVSQADMDELHGQFFDVEREARSLQDMATRLEAAVSDAVRLVDGARQDALQYGGTLAKASDQLSRQPEGLGALLLRLVAETREVSRRSDAAARRLTETARRTQALQAELVEARRLAMTDPLTGLGNRRLLEEALQTGLAAVAETPLALLMLDIDHFKAVNDSHGHPAGDAVLRNLAQTLEQGLGGNSTASRFGGEEFAIILTGSSLREAVQAADALRNRIGNAAVTLKPSGQRVSVTVSLGVAVAHAGESVAQLLERADQALYEAKRAGRNRVCSDPPLPKAGAVWI